jgi:hypothetical protein
MINIVRRSQNNAVLTTPYVRDESMAFAALYTAEGVLRADWSTLITPAQALLCNQAASLGDADACYDTIARDRQDTQYPKIEIRLSLSLGSVIGNAEPFCFAMADFFGGAVYFEDRSASGRRDLLIYQVI